MFLFLFSRFLRLRSALYGALFFAFFPGTQAETSIALFGPESEQEGLVTLLSGAGTVRTINGEELATVDSLAPDFLLIAPGAKVPPQSRRSIHRYREQRGNLILLEPTAFLYPARSEDAVSAVDFRNRESFSVRASAIGDKEPEVGLAETQTPDGSSNAIRVRTHQMGDGDVLLEIPLKDVRSPERNMLRFQARGSHGTGILYLSVRDRGGRRWIHFVDLDLEWNDYEVRMADFVRMSRDADGSERLVPEEANLLEVGMVSRILWPERDAEFSIGEVALARGVGEATVRSGEVALWEDQYRARGAFFPDWLQDPFEGTSTFRAANGSDGIYWEIPKPPYKRGRSDAPASTKLNAGDDLRRVLAAVESVEGDRKVVAEGRWFNDGPFAGGS
ncbi:MAG TPA: hypothetical protein VK041_01895, partial [Opitutales bacterium]|nr:hypothetical protein [Opitutales bacterium]